MVIFVVGAGWVGRV